MTGEVTLLGKVLPIGGLKEKMLAAKRAGIHKLIVPAENEAGMADFDADILEGMDISYVEQVKDVLKAVLIGGLDARHKAKPGSKATASRDDKKQTGTSENPGQKRTGTSATP